MRLALAGNVEAADVFYEGLRERRCPRRPGPPAPIPPLPPEVARLFDAVLEADKHGESPEYLWRMLGIPWQRDEHGRWVRPRKHGGQTVAATARDLGAALARETYEDAAAWFIHRSSAPKKLSAVRQSAPEIAAAWIFKNFGKTVTPGTALRWYEKRRPTMVAADEAVAKIIADMEADGTFRRDRRRHMFMRPAIRRNPKTGELYTALYIDIDPKSPTNRDVADAAPPA